MTTTRWSRLACTENEVDVSSVSVVVGNDSMNVLRETEIHRSSFMCHRGNDYYFFPQSILTFHHFFCSYGFDIQIILLSYSLHLLVEYGPILPSNNLTCGQDLECRQPCWFCRRLGTWLQSMAGQGSSTSCRAGTDKERSPLLYVDVTANWL